MNLEEEIITFYLRKEILEYLDCKEAIWAYLKLSPVKTELLIDALLYPLISGMAIYYPAYLKKDFGKRELERFLKKEIRCLLFKQKLTWDLNHQAQIIFEHAKPIFLNFDDQEELRDILETARELAKELSGSHGLSGQMRIGTQKIFSNDQYYRGLLMRLYGAKYSLKDYRRKCEHRLDISSGRIVLEKINLPGLSSLPKKNSIIKELQKAITAVIDKKVKGIFPTHQPF